MNENTAVTLSAIDEWIEANSLTPATAVVVSNWSDEGDEVHITVDIKPQQGWQVEASMAETLQWAQQRFGAAVHHRTDQAEFHRFWLVKPEVVEGLTRKINGLAWVQIARAMSWSNTDAELLDPFLQEYQVDQPVVVVANHSVGGRDWQLFDSNVAPLFLSDPNFDGGWYLFQEGEVTELFASSASSGSSLTARRNPNGTWSLELWVPLEASGLPYQGSYWAAFQTACGVIDA